jgi:hypothetical protein
MILNKLQTIEIPLASLISERRKYFFFKEKSYNQEKIEEIDKFVNITSELKKVVSTLFLLENPKTNFNTIERGTLDGLDTLTKYDLSVKNDNLIIKIEEEVEVKANEIRELKVYKTLIDSTNEKLEVKFDLNIEKVSNIPFYVKMKKGKRETKLKSTVKHQYRDRNSYKRYKNDNDNDFWDYYLLYELLSNSDYNDNIEYEFYDEYDNLIDLPSIRPEEYYDIDTNEDIYEDSNDLPSIRPEEYYDIDTNEDIYEDSNDLGTSIIAGATTGYVINEMLDGKNDIDSAISSFASDREDNIQEVEEDSYNDTFYSYNDDSNIDSDDTSYSYNDTFYSYNDDSNIDSDDTSYSYNDTSYSYNDDSNIDSDDSSYSYNDDSNIDSDDSSYSYNDDSNIDSDDSYR